MKILAAAIATCLCSFIFFMEVFSQDLPETDIYLLSIVKNQKGKYILGAPERITEWEGYDNQPWFLPDGTGLLYTSIREDSKADIYKFTFADVKTVRVINTPLTGEYSPMMMPDKSGISCVRSMEDDSTQLLYKFTGRDQNPTALFPNINPVGYYCWATNDVVAMFVLGDPQTLQ